MSTINRPKTILFVHHGSGDGGAAISLYTLIASLDRSVFIPIIVCDFRLNGVEQFFSPLNCTILNARINPFTHSTITWKWFTCRGFYYLSKWLFHDYFCTKSDLLQIVKAFRPHIVHFNGISLLLYSKCLSLYGSIVVQHIREPLHKGVFGIRNYFVTSYAKQFVSKIISISKTNALNFRTSLDKVIVLYNPVSLSPPCFSSITSLRSNLKISDFDFILFFPGGSAFEEKGIFIFLEALGLTKSLLGARTVCALIPGLNEFLNSSAHFSKRYSSLVQRFNLFDNVVSVPFTKSVQNYYFISDIVVAPFTNPHFSRAVIEAGVMLKPVIASNFDVISEVLQNDFNGLLVRPADPKDLASKIQFLLNNPDTCLRLATNGNVYSRRFESTSYGLSIMNLYNQLY